MHPLNLLAPLLTPSPGALVFRSDVERKALYGVTEYERLSPEACRREISQTVYGIVIDRAARVARAGHSAIIDAVFATAEERAALETAVAGARVEFCGLFLFTDLTTRLQRVGARAGRFGCRYRGRPQARRIHDRRKHLGMCRCERLAGASAR
jgi:uncharacterized protein